jgi:hypothetical protein
VDRKDDRCGVAGQRVSERAWIQSTTSYSRHATRFDDIFMGRGKRSWRTIRHNVVRLSVVISVTRFMSISWPFSEAFISVPRSIRVACLVPLPAPACNAKVLHLVAIVALAFQAGAKSR